MDVLKTRAGNVVAAAHVAAAEFAVLSTTAQLGVVLATLLAVVVVKGVVHGLLNPKVRVFLSLSPTTTTT